MNYVEADCALDLRWFRAQSTLRNNLPTSTALIDWEAKGQGVKILERHFPR